MDWYPRALAETAPWSYVLLCGQVILLALLIERALYMVLRASLNADAYLVQVRKLVVAGNVDRALKLAAAAGAMPIGRVTRAGLAVLGGGPFVLQEALDRALAEELPKVHYRLARILMVAVALAAVGVMGSMLLGVRDFATGGDGPLPLGLSIEHAPALLGVASGLVGLVGWLILSRMAGRVVVGLEQCKQVLLELGEQHGARR